MAPMKMPPPCCRHQCRHHCCCRHSRHCRRCRHTGTSSTFIRGPLLCFCVQPSNTFSLGAPSNTAHCPLLHWPPHHLLYANLTLPSISLHIQLSSIFLLLLIIEFSPRRALLELATSYGVFSPLLATSSPSYSHIFFFMGKSRPKTESPSHGMFFHPFY